MCVGNTFSIRKTLNVFETTSFASGTRERIWVFSLSGYCSSVDEYDNDDNGLPPKRRLTRRRPGGSRPVPGRSRATARYWSPRTWSGRGRDPTSWRSPWLTALAPGRWSSCPWRSSWRARQTWWRAAWRSSSFRPAPARRRPYPSSPGPSPTPPSCTARSAVSRSDIRARPSGPSASTATGLSTSARNGRPCPARTPIRRRHRTARRVTMTPTARAAPQQRCSFDVGSIPLLLTIARDV